MRQVATTEAAASCRKRIIKSVIAGGLWLVTASVLGPFLGSPAVNGTATALILGLIFVWTPGAIAYAWITAPGPDEAKLPIKHSRMALLYDKYLGINGTVKITLTPLPFSASASASSCSCSSHHLPHTTDPVVLQRKGPNLADSIRYATGVYETADLRSVRQRSSNVRAG